MEFGIFTVGDVTTDPTNGRTPTEHERIKNTVAIAMKAEEIGLDVFATGEHHNPPFAAPARAIPKRADWVDTCRPPMPESDA
jgi:alkanesulfonate monooxygenase SsuD/methylene tetrahydromethanopterin reductase-like flavin-dependent oxidoreductase (luciferase family)